MPNDFYDARFEPDTEMLSVPSNDEHTMPCRLRENAIKAGIDTDHNNCRCWCHG